MMENPIETTVVTYENQEIAFQNQGLDLWVNATAMAKPFGKRPYDFLKMDQTKEFIEAFKKRESIKQNDVKNVSGMEPESMPSLDYSPFKTIEGGATAGTFFHRQLALKFAAWLSPDFEIWIFETIDRLLNEERKEKTIFIERKALRRMRIAELEKKLDKIPEYLELLALRKEDRNESKKITRVQNIQISLFTSEMLKGK